jgi:hypothetical protein
LNHEDIKVLPKCRDFSHEDIKALPKGKRLAMNEIGFANKWRFN